MYARRGVYGAGHGGDHMKTTRWAVLVASALAAGAVYAAGAPLDALNGKLAATAPPQAGISLAEIDGDAAYTSFVGDAALAADTTFRLASNTKTYTAATVLRLWEEGRIRLDASIRDYVDPAYIALLDKDGYDTAKITVRHLLSHTSGIADHAQTRQFLSWIESRPDTAWTRESQLEALVHWTDPIAAPGAKFYYSDSGYCLLGNIIERLTGKPLAAAVRATLGFDKLGLSATYWETDEAPSPQAGPRAHLILDGHDTYNWNPTLDTYGGGGLVGTPTDMARFLAALFDGKVFRHPETLQLMISKQGLPADTPYRLGIFEYDAGGVKAYGHTGFWGTAAMYVPSQHRAYAFAVTRREAFKPAFEGVKAYIGAVAQ
jgi:D-alanyl-D-alanine carboxypeptidase